MRKAATHALRWDGKAECLADIDVPIEEQKELLKGLRVSEADGKYSLVIQFFTTGGAGCKRVRFKKSVKKQGALSSKKPAADPSKGR